VSDPALVLYSFSPVKRPFNNGKHIRSQTTIAKQIPNEYFNKYKEATKENREARILKNSNFFSVTMEELLKKNPTIEAD
jgi:hypothetical protein